MGWVKKSGKSLLSYFYCEQTLNIQVKTVYGECRLAYAFESCFVLVLLEFSLKVFHNRNTSLVEI